MYRNRVYFEVEGEEFGIVESVPGASIRFEGLDCSIFGQAIWNRLDKEWQMTSLHDNGEHMLNSKLCGEIIEHFSRFGVPGVKP